LSLERAPCPDGTTGQLTWYDFSGKTVSNYVGASALPSLTAVVLPDGSTRFTHVDRNSLSTTTRTIASYTATDASRALRTNTLIFAANEIDLLQQIGPNSEQVLSNYFGTRTDHQPITSYDALSQETRYTYNANHQATSVKAPAGLTTTNIYFASGTDASRLD